MSEPVSTTSSTISIVLKVFFFCISCLLVGCYTFVERLAGRLGVFSLYGALSTDVYHCSLFSTGIAVSFGFSIKLSESKLLR